MEAKTDDPYGVAQTMLLVCTWLAAFGVFVFGLKTAGALLGDGATKWGDVTIWAGCTYSLLLAIAFTMTLSAVLDGVVEIKKMASKK